MFKLRLIKGLSYDGIVTASAESPYVTTDSEETVAEAVATGYFEIVSEPSDDDEEAAAKTTAKSLSKMRTEELIAYAAEIGVDISDCTKNAQRIEMIEAALSAAADDDEEAAASLFPKE